MARDSRSAWSQFDVAAIPTKAELSVLREFLDSIQSTTRLETALDLGCGTGAVSALLTERGFTVVGVDVNAAAIDVARRVAPRAAFDVRDITSPAGLALQQASFDLVVCQLVLSIVGSRHAREQMVRNAHSVIAPNGWFYVSASGRSDDINPGYAALYAQDRAETGEDGTYYSRDASGNVLYITHHFTEAELKELLEGCGFSRVHIERRREQSSRRPGEAAWFLYATCHAE